MQESIAQKCVQLVLYSALRSPIISGIFSRLQRGSEGPFGNAE